MKLWNGPPRTNPTLSAAMLVDQNHRIELLRIILTWEGRLNNARIRELFDLSATRASEWIRDLRDRHPTWLLWDTSTKSYLAAPSLYKLRPSGGVREQEGASLSRYLSLTGVPPSNDQHSVVPTQWNAHPDLSVPPARVFAQANEAIRVGRRLKLVYRSMSNPQPHVRVVSPHSLVRAGRRWHMRAFCSTHQEFRDYTLGRIESPEILTEPRERDSSNDIAWNTMLKVRLVAHPALSIPQRELVQFEYFSGTSARSDSCRAALAAYFIQDVRAATDTDRQLPPDYQLAVENMKELRPWLFPS